MYRYVLAAAALLALVCPRPAGAGDAEQGAEPSTTPARTSPQGRQGGSEAPS
jgi:hypothetical protein